MGPAIDAPLATTCPVCGTLAPRRIEPRAGYDLPWCPACGLTFSSPMHAADAAFYEASTEYDDKWEFDFVPVRLAELDRHGALLDLGCGDGRFLGRVSERFAPTELDCWAPDRRFEAITAFHVLEHLEDPRAFVAHVARRLVPGGLLAVSVPNPDRWVLWWVREAWDYPPHHLTRWTARSLRSLLEQQGFEVQEVRTEPLRRWSQLRSACRDICWSLAVGPLSFGIGSRWASALSKREGTRWSSATAVAFARVRLGRALARLKGGLVESGAVALALALFLPMRLARWQGKSLLVLASLGSDALTGGRVRRP